jgi:hypothetical protein
METTAQTANTDTSNLNAANSLSKKLKRAKVTEPATIEGKLPMNEVEGQNDASKAEPKATKEQTPEVKANTMRRKAGELRRSADALGKDADGYQTLMDRADGLTKEADALSPKKTKTPTAQRPQCKGTKKDGTPCTAKAMDGSDYCIDHRPVRERFTTEQWDAFLRIPTTELIARLGWGVALKMAKAQLNEELKVK